MLGRIEHYGQDLRTVNQEQRAEEVVTLVDDEEQYSIERSSQNGTPVLWGTDTDVLDWVRTGGKRPW